jgi:hypothetical protein
MSRLAELTIAEWIGFGGLLVFTSILIWSLVVGFQSPPPDDRSK